MKRFLVRLRHLTWRKLLNKAVQTAHNISVSFTLRNVPQKNAELYDRLERLITGIDESNGSAYYTKADIKIGIITDEFMYNYYKDAASFIILSHDNYKETIDNAGLDVVMYVSCWRGMCNNDWYGDELHGDVPQAMKYANSKWITTIFQTIEDPTNYERYLPIAAECDYIFTTDLDCVQRYKSDTGNENVFLLEYGVNPIFHNPIGMNEKYSFQDEYECDAAFFAGSWMDRYKNRCRDISMIFNGVMESGKNLLIADRNVEVKLPGYRFPRKYQPFVVPAIEHTILQKVHKLFEFNININTVQDSPTMCAMRVYELQALGCVIISNYSLAVSENFPGVFMVNNPGEVSEIMKGYHRRELYRIAVDNLRAVMSDKTVFDRLNYIFEKCGIDHSFPSRRVVVVCKEKTDRICRMFASQTYAEKILVTSDRYSVDENEDSFVACFRDEYEYGENYLTDMMNAFKYCDIDFATKDENCKGKEYGFTVGEADIYATVMSMDKYRETIASGGMDKKLVSGKGFKLDSFGINEVCLSSEDDKEIAVIVPVYNNGEYLYGRCFRSLLRSSMFERMQIYLIDDGSDDENTINIMDLLARRYDNVTTYYFERGGSGSAARPRNKGVEISSEPYITYLDPDNEAINDGYCKLYEKLISTDADMAFGAIFMRATSEKLMRLGYLFKNKLIDDPKGLLISENFRSQSIQACLMKRELIENNGLKNPQGAFGEDTWFFHELMINAGSVYYLNEPIHIYYAQRMNSSINDIGKSFYEKSLILEEYQVKRLEDYGLLTEYINRKLDYFIINWYIDKLDSSKVDERCECIEIIDEIAKLYGKSIEDYAGYIKENHRCL